MSELAAVRWSAHALAFVVIANQRHTDLFEGAQRSIPPTLSAEIQRRLLPAAFTCEAPAFTLAGRLEPAGSVAGGTFDYSLGRDTLHLSITDAMGHGVDSGLIATLCLDSPRTSHRKVSASRLPRLELTTTSPSTSGRERASRPGCWHALTYPPAS